MRRHINFVLYIVSSIILAGCAAFNQQLGKTLYASFHPGIYMNAALEPIIYFEMHNRFPANSFELNAMRDSAKIYPKGTKFSYMDSDSICFKARVYTGDDSLNSDSYYEIIKKDTAYVCSLYLNDFIAKLDSEYIKYDDYRIKGNFSVKRDSVGKFKLNGGIIIQSGFLYSPLKLTNN